MPDGKQIPNPTVTGPVAKKPALEEPQNATNGMFLFYFGYYSRAESLVEPSHFRVGSEDVPARLGSDMFS